ncbi:MAG: type II toxin-antitoxin system RelE/ParE family toxin [bacterium]
MEYSVIISNSAEKELKSLDHKIADRIGSRLLILEDNPKPPNSKHLKGTTFYRLRIGDYRVIYNIDNEMRIINILSIGHRKEIYRQLKRFS